MFRYSQIYNIIHKLYIIINTLSSVCENKAADQCHELQLKAKIS